MNGVTAAVTAATSPLGKLCACQPWNHLLGSLVCEGRSRWTVHLSACVLDAADHHRIDGAPEGIAELVIVAQPDGATGHGEDGAVDQNLLVAALPDAAVVVGHRMVDAERTATRHTQGGAGGKLKVTRAARSRGTVEYA